MRRWIAVFVDVFLIQLASWRWIWRAMLVGGIMIPLVVFLMFWAVGGGQFSQERIFELATGNAVLSVVYTGSERVARRFAWLREVGAIDYLATLPIGRPTLIVATISAFAALSLPGLLVTLSMGIILGGVVLSPTVLVAGPVILLIVLGLVTPAALIGLWARNMEEATTIAEMTSFVLILGSPLLYPLENLPWVWQLISRLLPSTYAVEALRLVLRGDISWWLWLDVGILAGLSMIAFFVAGRKLEWMQ